MKRNENEGHCDTDTSLSLMDKLTIIFEVIFKNINLKSSSDVGT